MKLHNTILKNSLLLAAIATCATLSTTTAAALNDDAATPQRPAAESAFSVEQTPGQRTVQQQAEVFTEARFLEVFEEEGFNALLRILDSNTIKGRQSFNTLSDTTIPYDDHRKRILIRKVSNFMERFFSSRITEPAFRGLFIQVIDMKVTTGEVPYNRINESSTRYFQDKYPGSRVTCSSKMAGDQLGTVVKVQTADNRTFKYFVKTHSGGLRSEHSSEAKLVNPAELLVYKVLEGLGVGCQSHFFGPDGHNLYIATLDANTEGEFKEYSHYKGSKHTDVQKQVWGELTQLTTNIRLSDEQHQQAEDWIAADPVAQTCVHELSKQDLLARMLWLTDFQANTDNYGFTRLKDGSLRLKAIDFRLSQVGQIDQYRCSQGSFESFLSGPGLYHYISADKVMCYALRHRQQELRVQEARGIVTDELSQFEKIVDRAVQDVSQALNQVTMTDVEKDKTQADLEQYADIVKSNFRSFKTMLDEWSPVTTNAK